MYYFVHTIMIIQLCGVFDAVSEWASSFLTAHQHMLDYLMPCSRMQDLIRVRIWWGIDQSLC